jgi:hypothetical protein
MPDSAGEVGQRWSAEVGPGDARYAPADLRVVPEMANSKPIHGYSPPPRACLIDRHVPRSQSVRPVILAYRRREDRPYGLRMQTITYEDIYVMIRRQQHNTQRGGKIPNGKNPPELYRNAAITPMHAQNRGSGATVGDLQVLVRDRLVPAELGGSVRRDPADGQDEDRGDVGTGTSLVRTADFSTVLGYRR